MGRRQAAVSWGYRWNVSRRLLIGAGLVILGLMYKVGDGRQVLLLGGSR